MQTKIFQILADTITGFGVIAFVAIIGICLIFGGYWIYQKPIIAVIVIAVAILSYFIGKKL